MTSWYFPENGSALIIWGHAHEHQPWQSPGSWHPRTSDLIRSKSATHFSNPQSWHLHCVPPCWWLAHCWKKTLIQPLPPLNHYVWFCLLSSYIKNTSVNWSTAPQHMDDSGWSMSKLIVVEGAHPQPLTQEACSSMCLSPPTPLVTFSCNLRSLNYDQFFWLISAALPPSHVLSTFALTQLLTASAPHSTSLDKEVKHVGYAYKVHS